MKQYNILKGKNVFITGATGGLGSHIASEFTKAGCNLYLTATDHDKLEELSKLLKKKANSIQKIVHQQGDLRSNETLSFLAEDAKDKFGNIDILVNCAGVFIVQPLYKTTIDKYDNCFDVNVRAPFYFCRAFIEGMVFNKWGRIINIGSSSSYDGFKATSAYCASKHALLGLSRSLHDEYKHMNIRTFCFSPGSIKTRMGKKVKNQDFETFINPEEISEYIAFTISFDNEMVNEEIRLNRVNIQ